LIRREGRLDTGWVEGETAGCEFADVRLDRRFRELLAQIGDAGGESIEVNRNVVVVRPLRVVKIHATEPR